jgi:hypothetical protein
MMNDLMDRLTKLGPEQFKRVARSLGQAVRNGGLEPIARRTNPDGPVPMSFEQERMWCLDRLDPGNGTYNITNAARAVFPRELDLEALERSVNEVVRRHEALRTGFRSVDGRPVATVAPAAALHVPVDDLRHLPPQSREPEALRMAEADARQPFELHRAPLIRFRVLRLDERDYVLVLTTHHIVSDAWSLGIVVKEIATIYLSAVTGLPSLLREPPIQYGDFAAWQRQRLQGPELDRLLGYWTSTLHAPLPLLQLRTDTPRGAAAFRAANVQGLVASPVAQRLKALARRETATIFMVLLAALEAVLHRYTAQTDLIVGSAVANRSRPELERLVGLFINIIALRTDVSGNPTFRELLSRVRATCEGAYAHDELAFARLLDAVPTPRDPRYHPLFQVLFLLQNAAGTLDVPGLVGVRPLYRDTGGAKRDLSVYAEESADGFRLRMKYRTDLFERSTIEQMMADYVATIEQIAADPLVRLEDLKLSDAGDLAAASGRLAGHLERAGQTLDLSREAQPRTAPRDGIETAVAAVWEQLLDRRGVVIEDNFFALGGDSFLGMRALHQIESRLGVSVPLPAIFEPTLADMAARVREQTTAAARAAAAGGSR